MLNRQHREYVEIEPTLLTRRAQSWHNSALGLGHREQVQHRIPTQLEGVLQEVVEYYLARAFPGRGNDGRLDGLKRRVVVLRGMPTEHRLQVRECFRLDKHHE